MSAASKVPPRAFTTPAKQRQLAPPRKYAVHWGGGRNHRTGLIDAILIKDNHLALAAEWNQPPAGAVQAACSFAQLADAQYVTKDMLVGRNR
jgi:nicotinate-nucleotide pyrophosphorylase